jgi:hypothetical protein
MRSFYYSFKKRVFFLRHSVLSGNMFTSVIPRPEDDPVRGSKPVA